MTDKEIIKALECMLGKYSVGEQMDCVGCLFETQDLCYENASEGITKAALNLIIRQQAEIERLTVNMNAFGLGMKREKERADTARTEAIKEFAKKAKKALTGWSTDPTDEEIKYTINNLVKEMTGETKTDTDFPKDYSYGY